MPFLLVICLIYAIGTGNAYMLLMQKIIVILILGIGFILLSLISWVNFQLDSFSHSEKFESITQTVADFDDTESHLNNE